MLLRTNQISIPARKIRAILNDPEKTANAVNLIYVNDTMPGIKRIRKGKSFIYVLGNKKIDDEEILGRIRSLVLPPAWNNVWICRLSNGHLQATGIDQKKRKQYKYHPNWNTLRNHTKFYRLTEFGKCIPEIRRRLDEDLKRPGLPLDKVLAAIVGLMELTSIRIGSSIYEKLYGSFGLTTLKDKHVEIKGDSIKFFFRGKKGVSQKISIKSQRLAKIVKQCRDIPGKELFQYIDEQGEFRCIDSGMVNDYIQKISGKDFTAKDFRTWAGTVQALIAIKDLPKNDENSTKKNILTILDCVAAHLGNTRTVCKKYYVHPVIINLFENGRLQKYLNELKDEEKCNRHDLACEEKLLLKILEKESLMVHI
jgi:DNA topoisomerase I